MAFPKNIQHTGSNKLHFKYKASSNTFLGYVILPSVKGQHCLGVIAHTTRQMDTLIIANRITLLYSCERYVIP